MVLKFKNGEAMERIEETDSNLIGMIIAIVGVAGVGGWIANIVKLTHCSFQPLTPMPVIRVIGIFVPPLGAVLGYL